MRNDFVILLLLTWCLSRVCYCNDRKVILMEKQTAGRDNLGKLALKFAELNDDVLFGEIWSREDKLTLRNRSMITIAALMA